MSQRLGDLLVKEKVITPEQLSQASKVQKETNCRLGSALVKLGFLSDEDVTNFLSRQYGVPAINLSYFEIDPAVVKLIPFETAKRYQILPLSRVGASLTIAMVDPTWIGPPAAGEGISVGASPVISGSICFGKGIAVLTSPSFAIPKSSTFTRYPPSPFGSNQMLSGFKSR